jgi:DNA-binding GntR family transcriptional regulator
VGTIVTEIDRETLLQTQDLRKELALLLPRVSPVADIKPLAHRVAEIRGEAEALGEAMTVRDFARLNARFFEVMLGVTQNAPLRDVCTRLYYRSARLWVHSAPLFGFADEVGYFLAEMREVQSALERGDAEAVGHIRWLHLAQSADRQRRQHDRAGPQRLAS